MYIDRMKLMEGLNRFASPKSRLTRLIQSGKVIQVKRGIYLAEDDQSFSKKSLANIIYGPSYISFEYALSQYGLIPERVPNLTSAIFRKNKNKSFNTPVGLFLYYYLPAGVYPYGVVQKKEDGQSYLIATPEKAICDALYRIRKITSPRALISLLEEDLRIDIDKLLGMNKESFRDLLPLYRCKIHQVFHKWFLGGE